MYCFSTIFWHWMHGIGVCMSMYYDNEYQLLWEQESTTITLGELFQKTHDEVAKYKDRLTPAVILIPGKAGSLGIGMKNITSSVERAVGADIL